MSGDMLEKAIARAARQWTWAWLALTSSPVPRWATYPRFLVCCGFRYGFRACDELVIRGGWRRAGWTAGVELAKLQASHRKAGRCKIVDWVSTKTLAASCRPGVASMLHVRPIALKPAAMRLTCESQNNRSSICAAQCRLGLDCFWLYVLRPAAQALHDSVLLP